MRRDGNVSDASPIVREEDQHEQEAVRRGRDDEEISRHDLADMISQECLPGLPGRLAPTSHVFGDRGLRDVDPELQQFAMDTRRAPKRVRLSHGANQRAASAGTAGRPIRWRLFHVHHTLKPRRRQAMTVSGWTMTSAARHSVHTRESTTQSQRSAFASRNRRGRARCSTCS